MHCTVGGLGQVVVINVTSIGSGVSVWLRGWQYRGSCCCQSVVSPICCVWDPSRRSRLMGCWSSVNGPLIGRNGMRVDNIFYALLLVLHSNFT